MFSVNYLCISRILVFLKCYPKVAQRVLEVQEPFFVSRWQKMRLHPKVITAGLHAENWGKNSNLFKKKNDFIRNFTSNRNCYILYASLYKIWSWFYWLLKTSLGQYQFFLFKCPSLHSSARLMSKAQCSRCDRKKKPKYQLLQYTIRKHKWSH